MPLFSRFFFLFETLPTCLFYSLKVIKLNLFIIKESILFFLQLFLSFFMIPTQGQKTKHYQFIYSQLSVIHQNFLFQSKLIIQH